MSNFISDVFWVNFGIDYFKASHNQFLNERLTSKFGTKDLEKKQKNPAHLYMKNKNQHYLFM